MRRPPPPWLFAIASLPYGVFNGLIALALPYLMRRHGVSVERIASVVAIIQAPAIWYFLWAPIIDLRYRRRTWVLMLSAASGICVAVALGLDFATRLGPVTLVLLLGSVISQPISSALGGLVAAVTPRALRGRTSGWGQAGALGGGVLAAGLALWLSERWGGIAIGIAIGLLLMLPAGAVFAVDEPHRPKARVRDRARALRRELLVTLRRRKVWLAFALFLSPAGAGAMMNLYPAIAVDYHASTNVVIWIAGVGGGLLMAVGALVGGFACERFDPWLMYPLTGVLAALSAGAMLRAPLTPAAFMAGVSSYALATGFGYAAFMSLALELLGTGTAASSTRFTLFIAATNAPLVYMIWLDGIGHAHFGVPGMLAVDACANGVFGLMLLASVRPLRARLGRGDRKRFPEPAGKS